MFQCPLPCKNTPMGESDQNLGPTVPRRRLRFSLVWLIALTTACAIAVNLLLAQPTKEITSIIRLLVAAGFVVVGAVYLAGLCRGTQLWHKWVAFAAWAVAAWGVVIVFCTSSYLLGALLIQVLEPR